MTDPAQPSTALVRSVGAPSKVEQVLTEEMIRQVAELLSEGHYQETVAELLGIHRKTWYRWMVKGEDEPDTLFGAFCHTVKRAMALAEIMLIREIRGAPDNWQSRAWIAERRFQERWGRRLDITVRREAEQLAAQVGCTVEELLADAERIVAEAQAGVQTE